MLLDALTEEIPVGDTAVPPPGINIAIIGRPSVGKSTFLNQLVGAERSIVSAEPGARATPWIGGGAQRKILSLSGHRGHPAQGKTKLIAEKLSVIMARQHLERADIALLIADAAMGITSHDATIASYAEQSGRSVIIVMNKWDLALKAAQEKSADQKNAAENLSRSMPISWCRITSRWCASA